MPFKSATRTEFLIASHLTVSSTDKPAGGGLPPSGTTDQTSAIERSSNITVLGCIIIGVAALHLLCVNCLFRPNEQIKPAEPLRMEVSTLTIPLAKAEQLPAKLPPPALKQPQKPLQPKPKLKKPEPNKATAEYSNREQVLDRQPPVDNQMPAASDPSNNPSAETGTPTPTEIVLNAAYERISKPDYPAYAQIQGWEGKVMLRVQVNPEGHVDSVAVEESSGHETLDESAANAVKQWRFVPAMRGEATIASSVLIPIIFSLEGQDWG